MVNSGFHMQSDVESMMLWAPFPRRDSEGQRAKTYQASDSYHYHL